MLLALACGEDGNPVAPDSPGGVIPDPPHPIQVIREAFRTRSPSRYSDVLSADFIFSPTDTDSLRDEFAGTGVFAHWARDVEFSVFPRFFDDARAFDVEFPSAPLINKNVFLRYRVEYELNITDRFNAVTTYRGVAHFDIRNENGTWRLVRWDEVENVAGYESWGFLRGNLRPRW
jgi:hypothetical protein